MNVFANILNSSLSPHRPCLYLSLAMAIGICCGRYGPFSWKVWGILAGIGIGLSLFEKKMPSLWLCLTLFSLGALSFQHSYLFSSRHIAFLSYQEQKQVVSVEGLVDSDVQNKLTAFNSTKQVFEFKVKRIQLNGGWQESEGSILVNFFPSQEVAYGDHLRLEGKLYKAYSDPSSRFSYQSYLEEHGLFFNFSVGKAKKVELILSDQGNRFLAVALKVKEVFKDVLVKYLEPFEVNIIQAMVLGDRSLMTKDTYALFSKTGTSHILAISGMNMAIISAIFLFILKVLRFPRAWQFILTGLFLLFYAVLSGWSASVVRSVLMAVVLLSSFCVEYEADTLNSLGIAALILFFIDPANLFDLGFQLSFISVGIIILSNPLIQPLINQHVKGRALTYLAQALGISFMAFIGVSGIIAYEFNIITPIGILANIPVVFLADLIILLSLGLMVSGLICPLAAYAFAGTLKLVFHSMLELTAWFAQIPGGYAYLPPVNNFYVFMYYCALIIVYLVIRRQPLFNAGNTKKSYDFNNFTS